jgi:hypothetical protein
MNIYGVHDANRDWAGIIRDFAMSGWAVISESIGDDPTNHSGGDYSYLAAYGVTPIVRLNYSHHGEGTIPLSTRYNAFAERCANFVTASSGCRHWVIGNEPNLRAERYADVPITPRQYAECFDKCRTQIKHRSVQHVVMPAAIAPYNADTGWCMDYWREMLSEIVMNDGGADGLAIHCYSRGPIPNSVRSDDKMDAPYQAYSNGFRAYRDFLALVPAIMRALPVYITETDQLEPWADTNSGWVRAAYDEIDQWNKGQGNQGIHCLALYRWENFDQWGFCRKNGVIDDFRAALTLDYQAPSQTPITPSPEPPQPTPAPEPARDIDPRLLARGVHFDYVHVPAGTGYWRIVKAFWLDEDEADAVGPDHHILGTTVRDGAEMAGVALEVTWPSGIANVVSKADQQGATYNYDFPMSSSLNEFAITVDDFVGNPSDKASGIGMGAGGNPSIHTSTWIDFEWTISEGSGPGTGEPDPPPILPPLQPGTGHLIWPVSGPITQRWGENPDFYQQALGIPYHNGTDIGVPIGTEVVASGDGIIKWVDDDPQGYGVYCRLYVPAVRQHVVTAHLDRCVVQVGDEVRQGQVIAYSGNSGLSSGPHCHVETRAGTEHTYAQGTFGNSNGRADPQAVFWALGGTQEPIAGPGR